MQQHLELDDVTEADYIFISHAHFDQYVKTLTGPDHSDEVEVFPGPIDLLAGREQ